MCKTNLFPPLRIKSEQSNFLSTAVRELPPKRQVALLGENPQAKRAMKIQRPIAERACCREANALKAARNGEWDSYSIVLAEVQRRFDSAADYDLLEHFPYSWLQLDRINFMSPDPEHFPLYDKKRLNEALAFFRHAIENNVPVPYLLTADYSFVNADLAKVHGFSHDVELDSNFENTPSRTVGPAASSVQEPFLP